MLAFSFAIGHSRLRCAAIPKVPGRQRLSRSSARSGLRRGARSADRVPACPRPVAIVRCRLRQRSFLVRDSRCASRRYCLLSPLSTASFTLAQVSLRVTIFTFRVDRLFHRNRSQRSRYIFRGKGIKSSRADADDCGDVKL